MSKNVLYLFNWNAMLLAFPTVAFVPRESTEGVLFHVFRPDL